jgi:hypothetical protein
MSKKSKKLKKLERFIEGMAAYADEVLSDRTPEEIAYDNEVIAALDSGLSIESALAKAAEKHPDEALLSDDSQVEDVASYYENLHTNLRILERIAELNRKPL